MIKARVYRSSQRVFDCKVFDSGEMIQATALGNLLKEGSVVVGDIVEIEQDDQQLYTIHKVQERKSEIFRMIVRENKKKVTAANCDLMVILCSMGAPPYKRGVVDRFLLRSQEWGIPALVIFNKMDQFDPESGVDLTFERDRLKNAEVECFEISAKVPEYRPQFLEKGLDELKETLAHQTAIFLGQSGVGKSHSITTLSEGKFELKTRQVGKVGKGTHTTTWSEMVDVGPFQLIDSPGIRSFSLDDLLPEDLIHYFPDLLQTALSCKFNNCAHDPKSKGCSFYENYSLDTYQGQLVFSRLESYLRFLEEAKSRPAWDK